jgi:23S rRNA (guanosine2251-2'-O)-methyltransferase
MSRYVFGIHPALETLSATPGEVERVLIAEGPARGPLAEVIKLARQLGIRVETLPRQKISQLAAGGVHQGVVLRVAEFSYSDLVDVIEKARAAGKDGLVLVLDGIEDPHNFGALVRSASALGAQGVVIAKDRAVGVTPTVVKASAGAIAHLPVARVTNLARSLSELKDAGLWAVAADMSGDRLPEQVDMRSPTVLVIGNEGQGIRRIVLEACDFRVSIPMSGPVASLNASVAGGILLYEVARQRRVGSGESSR